LLIFTDKAKKSITIPNHYKEFIIISAEGQPKNTLKI